MRRLGRAERAQILPVTVDNLFVHAETALQCRILGPRSCR
jgi:hypothetical protein